MMQASSQGRQQRKSGRIRSSTNNALGLAEQLKPTVISTQGTQKMEHNKVGSRQTFSRNCVGEVYHEGMESGITFNRVAELQPYEDAVVAEEQANGTAAENVAGIRKILHPGDALDSVRQTAEMIIKDAMEALQRTKQRLMDILPQSLNPSASPQKPDKLMGEAEMQSLAESDVVTSAVLSPSLAKVPTSIKSELRMGHPTSSVEKGVHHRSKL